jgi:hypothetical protein
LALSEEEVGGCSPLQAISASDARHANPVGDFIILFPLFGKLPAFGYTTLPIKPTWFQFGFFIRKHRPFIAQKLFFENA